MLRVLHRLHRHQRLLLLLQGLVRPTERGCCALPVVSLRSVAACRSFVSPQVQCGNQHGPVRTEALERLLLRWFVWFVPVVLVLLASCQEQRGGQRVTWNSCEARLGPGRYPKSRSLVILLKQGFTKFFTFTKGFY